MNRVFLVRRGEVNDICFLETALLPYDHVQLRLSERGRILDSSVDVRLPYRPTNAVSEQQRADASRTIRVHCSKYVVRYLHSKSDKHAPTQHHLCRN
jgi:hypothetical protein